jgi:hypothetical protein
MTIKKLKSISKVIDLTNWNLPNFAHRDIIYITSRQTKIAGNHANYAITHLAYCHLLVYIRMSFRILSTNSKRDSSYTTLPTWNGVSGIGETLSKLTSWLFPQSVQYIFLQRLTWLSSGSPGRMIKVPYASWKPWIHFPHPNFFKSIILRPPKHSGIWEG